MVPTDHLSYWLQLLLDFWLLLMVSSQVFSTQLDSYLDCSANFNLCEVNPHGHTVTMQANNTCGECRLWLNTTKDDTGIQLQIEISSIWSALNYFYIEDTNQQQFWAFTGNTDMCKLRFPVHEMILHFYATASLTLTVFTPNVTSCQDSLGQCGLVQNCSNFKPYSIIHKMFYQEEISVLDTKYTHPKIYKWYGHYEFSASLPLCPVGCHCMLQFQQMIVQCPKQEFSILMIHTYVTNSTYRTAIQSSKRNIISITPGTFEGLTYVGRLSLNRNSLTSIQSDTFRGLQSLIVLEIADNKLEEIQHDALHGLPLILFVDLNKNRLQSLHPDTFKYQSILLALDLSDNHLTELSAEMLSGFRKLHVLLLDRNNLTMLHPDALKHKGLSELWWLYLDDNNLHEILPGTFRGQDLLYRLHLSGNKLKKLEASLFEDIPTLFELTLNRINLTNLPDNVFEPLHNLLLLELEDNNIEMVDLNVFNGLQELVGLRLSNNKIRTLEVSSNAGHFNKTLLPRLRVFEVTNNTIDRISKDFLVQMPNLRVFQLRDNPLKKVDTSSFKALSNKTVVSVDEPATCCFINKAECKATNLREPYLTCQRLLPNFALRMFMWIFGLSSFLGNISVLLWRCIKHGRENIVQVILIENLAASDFLMGVYMLIIASADYYYQQYFPSEAEVWRNGIVCKIAGILSVLSSEGSVFIVTLISIDRFLAIKYPSGKHRFDRKSVMIALIFVWILALALSIIPTSVSGVDPNFYDVSEVCIGLPFVRSFVYINDTAEVELTFDYEDYSKISSDNIRLVADDYFFPESGNSPGLYFSIAVFLGLNLVCFLIVAGSYVAIFILYKQSAGRMHKSRKDEDIALAVRMGAIVLTDFCCWMPIIIIGVLVQAAVIDISPIVYVYIVVFVLPINSAVNPYIYTISTTVSDYRQRTSSKRNIQSLKRSFSFGQNNSDSSKKGPNAGLKLDSFGASK